MKKRIVFGIGFVAAVFFLASAQTSAQFSAGINITDDGVKSFYLAIGEHYRVPEQQVVVVRQKQIPDEELPVVFFLATRAKVAPDVIVSLRIGGKSWLEIAQHYKLSPEIFYVEVGEVSGPPYGRAYGHFRKRPRSEWRSIVLSDVDIVNLVNLRFMVDHYKYAPDQVIKWRSEGKRFVTINQEIRKGKQGKRTAIADADGNEPVGKSKSQGKGKGKPQK